MPFAGRLSAAAGTSVRELERFERELAHLRRAHPDLAIHGNRLPLGTSAEGLDQHAPPPHVPEPEPEPFEALSSGAAPRLFRRDTAFRSNVLGHSVPEWGIGMAPTQTFGPFLDEHDLPTWFDLFQPLSLVSVFFAGVTSPVLRIPLAGLITGRATYRLEAGSVWMASRLIASAAALDGRYTGLLIRGGSLTLSQAATLAGDRLVLKPATTASLHLDLAQPPHAADPHPAGGDAIAAAVALPASVDLHFQLQSSGVEAGAASCTVFGSTARLTRTAQTPVWLEAISQILVPFDASIDGDAPGRFAIRESRSSLCTPGGDAPIDPRFTGWLLPASTADPLTLGTAAGAGAICLTLKPGLRATWRTLAGAATMLAHPSIIVEPNLVTVLDFTASNTTGRQKWTLWRNAANRHHSQITLTFGKQFPFVFVSSTANSEGVFCFCAHAAALDRPVDANGRPFTIASSIAFAATTQIGTTCRALLVDTDLLFDGTPGSADDFRAYSVALRNALFTVSAPRALAFVGDLNDEDRIAKGVLAITHDIHRYLPTLPDPYVASYTAFLREPDASGLGRLQQALTGVVTWPDHATRADDAPDPADPRALVRFTLTPMPPAPPASAPGRTRSFLTGVATSNQDVRRQAIALTRTSLVGAATVGDLPAVLASAADAAGRVADAARCGTLETATRELQAHPLLRHLPDLADKVERVAETAARTPMMATAAAGATIGRTSLDRDVLMLLDVSSRADQMGVSIGPAWTVTRDVKGDAALRKADAAPPATLASTDSRLALQIMNMDVVAPVPYVRAATLPQVSWEPVFNIPLPIEGPPDPGDTVTVTPGLIVYDNDGIPTRLFSESPFPVPIAPVPVTHHIVKEFNDQQTPRAIHSVFTLPFGMVAQADFTRALANPEEKNTRLALHMPHFEELRGGLQIKARAPESVSALGMSPSFPGWTLQIDNLRWALFGLPLHGTTLGATVAEIFNRKFRPYGDDPRVPLERIDISGYGASIFSNWINPGAAVADVSQTQFDVVSGRTAHEVVQVRSILYPFGVHLVRTITLIRANSGYVFRSDSGWKAESDGFYDFSYTLDLKDLGSKHVPNPYEFHTQPVKGVSRVREIRDFPAAGPFDSSFRLDDPDLPPELQPTAFSIQQWKRLFSQVSAYSDTLDVRLQAVEFDADVHLDNVVSGGVAQGGTTVVPSRRMLGYVQLAPSSILLPSRVFAELLRFQHGSLGGPVDCVLDVAQSSQKMRVQRVDVNPAANAAGKSVFVTAARGSLVLPNDGAWSIVKQQTTTGDVTPLAPQEGVPLIKPNASPDFLIAHPADVHQPASNVHFGIVQSTGTQKLLFDVPQFSPGVAKLKSAQTYFADAYKLLNSKGPFPNVANALGLTPAEREVEILGEGLMKMADRTLKLDTLLPAGYSYPFIDEPGVLRIYAQYKSTGHTSGELALGLDSAAALEKRWKAAVSNMRVVVDLGPFKELMWVDGHFAASSGIAPKYDKPHLQFGPVLEPVVEILQVLATLTGEDFDRGMSVGMSNSADTWEYKFNCSKEIPVIKFPSPEQLTINPNPPLKLEAGLRVGFYFNEKLSIPTDLKQLVPACGAYVEFYGGLEVQCFTLAVASVYAVGHVTLGIAADSKAGVSLHMKFGFGAEVVVGLPVVANVSVLYMVEVEVSIAENALDVAGLLLFRGSAEICGGLVGICIQIEAGGSVHRENDVTNLTAQVTFSIDVCVLWVIDIDVTEHWQEQRQIA